MHHYLLVQYALVREVDLVNHKLVSTFAANNHVKDMLVAYENNELLRK
jgi:hypothetical protein